MEDVGQQYFVFSGGGEALHVISSPLISKSVSVDQGGTGGRPLWVTTQESQRANGKRSPAHHCHCAAVPCGGAPVSLRARSQSSPPAAAPPHPNIWSVGLGRTYRHVAVGARCSFGCFARNPTPRLQSHLWQRRGSRCWVALAAWQGVRTPWLLLLLNQADRRWPAGLRAAWFGGGAKSWEQRRSRDGGRAGSGTVHQHTRSKAFLKICGYSRLRVWLWECKCELGPTPRVATFFGMDGPTLWASLCLRTLYDCEWFCMPRLLLWFLRRW
jgi:hypothetical protein